VKNYNKINKHFSQRFLFGKIHRLCQKGGKRWCTPSGMEGGFHVANWQVACGLRAAALF
jgi:hypothetical protein